MKWQSNIVEATSALKIPVSDEYEKYFIYPYFFTDATGDTLATPTTGTLNVLSAGPSFGANTVYEFVNGGQAITASAVYSQSRELPTATNPIAAVQVTFDSIDAGLYFGAVVVGV